MNSTIESIIKYFISISVITSAFVYISKSLFNNFLNKNIEKYKLEMAKVINIETERYKKDLEHLQIENEIRFKRLHEERANTIKELYKRLIDLELNLQAFYGTYFCKENFYFSSLGINADYDIVQKKMNDFIYYYEINKLFFGEEICKALHIIRDTCGLISFANKFTKEDLENNYSGSIKALIFDIIPEQKILLENEFRNLIGVM